MSTIPLILKLLPLLTLTYIFLRKLLHHGPPNGSIPLPGPPGLPIIGNALQFPAVNPWRKLKTWADEYGPIYQISALGKTFVVLGSEEVANDLLRARGGIYSDRHYIAVLRDEIHLPVVRYGDTWRRQRKFFHFAQLQSQTHNPHYTTALTQNVHRTINELLAAYSTSSPKETPTTPTLSSSSPSPTKSYTWHTILDAYVCGTVTQLAYGQVTKSSTEPHVRTWTRFYNEFEKCAEPARYAVNVFPWLRFVPSWLGPWKGSGKKYLAEERAQIEGMFYGDWESMRLSSVGEEQKEDRGSDDDVTLAPRKKDAGEQPWSIAALYWADPGKWTTSSPATNLTAHEAAYTLGAFIEASMAGTPAALKLLIQAMLWYPEWQDRIYEQICEVCGVVGEGEEEESQRGTEAPRGGTGEKGRTIRPRMPTLSDSPNLPVIRAVIKETLRWRPTLPGGFPHRLMQDDFYTPPSASVSTSPNKSPPSPSTYHLPKNTLLLWHHHTMTRNASTYPTPEKFNPSRFLDAEKFPQTAKLPLTKYPTCMFDPAFGFGRRMCPGMAQAEDLIFLCVAWMCCVGRVERKRREQGRRGAEGTGERKGNGRLDDRFEPVPWYEYDEGRPTRPAGFEFEIVEREGWRGRLAEKKKKKKKKESNGSKKGGRERGSGRSHDCWLLVAGLGLGGGFPLDEAACALLDSINTAPTPTNLS